MRMETGMLEGGASYDEIWREWKELDQSIVEIDERAHREAAGVFALYEARRDELWAPIFHRMNEIEARSPTWSLRRFRTAWLRSAC